MIKWPEPVAIFYQADLINGSSTPPLKEWRLSTNVNYYIRSGCVVKKLVTESQLKQAVRDAIEMCARVAQCRDLPDTAAAIRALIKEIDVSNAGVEPRTK